MPTPDDGPFAEQRRIFDLLSQETRHLIIQFVLGHPDHLPSLAELDHAMPKSKAAIKDQLDRLTDEGLLAEYHYEPSESKRDLPATFYGPTERGVEILYDYKYLRGVPVIRSLYDHMKKPENIQRHEDAPRPDLPENVREALEIDGNSESAEQELGPREQLLQNSDEINWRQVAEWLRCPNCSNTAINVRRDRRDGEIFFYCGDCHEKRLVLSGDPITDWHDWEE